MRQCSCMPSEIGNCRCWNGDNLTVGNVIPANNMPNDMWKNTATQWSNVIPKPIQPTLTLKEQFINDYEAKNGKVKYIVVAVEMPNGAIELISNCERLFEKYKYYNDMYNNNFELMNNVMVKIVNYMIV